jgi:broad specificity phosphatase PhoE
MASPTVALIRHASTAWSGRRYCGRTDLPLDADGRRAAVRLADGLVGTLGPGDRIVSSPLDRALSTARAIAAATGATVELDERWREVDFGAVEGLTFDEVERRWPDIGRRIAAGETSIDWPDGEAATAFGARVRTAWDSLGGDARPTAVVAHGGPILVVLARLTERSGLGVGAPAPGSIIWVPGPRGSMPANGTPTAEAMT